MPIIKPQGLQSLKGLGSLSKRDYDTFVERNQDLIASHNYDPVYINNLYSNKQFIDKFGVEQFKAIPDISVRNNMYRDAIVNEEWDKIYNPINPDGTRDNNRGLGSDWEKYNQMSTDAKLKLLESDYLNPTEFEDNWNKHIEEVGNRQTTLNNSGAGAFMPLGASMGHGILSSTTDSGMADVLETMGSGEGAKEHLRRQNQSILDHIYNDDADVTAKKLSTEVSQVYQDAALAGLSDDQIKEAFVQAITPTKTNMGVSTYAAYYGDGSNVESEMKDFGIEDMREVLAKKAVYDQYMSPEMASTALNNDAKRYIKEHQGSMTRFGLWAKDVGISAMSYTADKVNGIYNVGLWAADEIGDKPVVWVDDAGNVIAPDKVMQAPNGAVGTMGEDGNIHPVHQEQIARTTLHNMGKNFDGSDADSGVFHLNPQYWTKAEQFGTLSEAEQKQYEKLGVSPYKVAYDPNEETDLWYESFKMASFGLADGASMFIPYGIGQIGKVLSTAGKVGKIGRGLGSALNFAGKAMGVESRLGQAAQGIAGAGGIAYAYQRGAFNETLQQNLANAEQTVLDRSRNEIYEQYNNDEDYKNQIDSLINVRAVSMKADYVAQMVKDGGSKIVDEKALDEMIHARAQEQVLGEMVQQKVAEKKGSQEYADLQEKAINMAGDAALTTFFPEAVKYGIVNTIGFRSWLYKNPASLQQKAGQVFKGIKEVTTAEGKQRLASEASKFATRGDKLKQFGKVLGSQAWGGAWTNGTDDMMVDAAERINEDSYNKYLNAYATGEPIADTYGFADGLYSYWKGINNSLGQGTTWDAAAVGGLGSIVSVTPNMANIAHYMTKRGRADFQNRYKEGTWRDKANYFIQNGVLNTYYGAKINEWDQKNHVDYVNNILDDYDDFKVVEDLITSDIGLQNAGTIGDQKTMEFVKAINALNALNHLANDKNDPAAMSTVVNDMKAMIDRAAKMSFDPNEEGSFSEEEARDLVAQYYANNPGLAHSEYNSQKALYDIAQNAQELKDAAQAYDDAEKQVLSVERSRGQQIAPEVRAKMKMDQALNGHWQKRVDTMKEEIGDMSTNNELSDDMVIASVGGKRNAANLIKVYNKQQAELEKELEEQKVKTNKKQDVLKKAEDTLAAATTSDEEYAAQQAVKEAQAEVDNAFQQEDYLKGLTQRTIDKKDKVEKALVRQTASEAEGTPSTEEVLSADEIFGLDSVTRARMMNPDNRTLYNEAQQREIEKLEQRLLMKDGDALQKIQDIALLTQRIEANQDAYSRMAKNPEAAAVQLEAQRQQSADTAYRLINQRNAGTVADVINQFEEGMKGHDDVTQEQKDEFVFRTLRKLNPTILNIIQEDKLLPQYQQQVQNAREWGEVTSDIDAVINESDNTDAWKGNISKNISQVIDNANNKDEVITALEKVIDDTDNTQAAADVETVLQGLEKLGYNRDATVVENRGKRRARQAEEKAAKEAAAKKSQEDAQAEAAKKATEEQEKKWVEESKQKNTVNADGSNLQSPWDVAPIDQSEETAVQQGELSEELDLNKPIVTKPSYHSSMKSQIGEKKSNWDYYTESEKETRDTKEGKLILGIAMQSTLQPSINYAIDAGVLDEGYKLSDATSSMENSTKVREATKALKDLGINTPQQLIEFVEQNDGKNLEGNKKESPAVNNSMESNLIDNGETVQGKSSTIDEQAVVEGQKEQHTSDEITDVAVVNGTGEHIIETSATTLNGNAMSEYQPEPLQNEGKLEHKKGENPNDSMNKFYAWMNATGIKLQDIIDTELAEILRRNPQAKVKFMAVRPQSNATNDGDMKRHLMLVLDYDNSINKGITNIHNDDNGGVLESNGKKYLVIGIAGYGNKNADKLALYDILFSNNPNSQNGYGLVRRGMGEYFRNNPNERFYVPEGLSTEVVAGSLIPGYIIKQLEGEESTQYRSITELLDQQRNPLGLDIQSLAWGIQEKTKFLVIGTPLDRVMVPRNVEGNLGSAFVLVPAANGKMVPSYLKPLFYNEMNDGKLKDRVNDLLMDVVSPNYVTRLAAISELSKIFYFGKDGDNILLGKDGSRYNNEVSLKRGEDTLKTFVLNSDFDRQQFMEAFADMNPRINITASVLQSPVMLQQYDEAGALQTDIARLATAGSSYSICGVDAQGNMIKPDAVNNDIPRDAANTEFRNGGKTQVIFNQNFYQYDVTTDQYLLNGEVVKDENTIRQLDYNRKIIESGLIPVETKGTWKYYILGSEEHPEVVMVNKNTYEVQEMKNKQAQDLIDKVAKEKADKEREEAAKQRIEKLDKMQREAVEKGEANLSEEWVVDPETGELVVASEIKEKKEKEEEAPAEQQNPSQENTANRGIAKPQVGTQGNTQTFNNLVKSKAYRVRVITTIKNKWPQAPTKISELEQFLKEKNIEVDAIGTSEADVQAWIKTLEDCR